MSPFENHLFFVRLNYLGKYTIYRDGRFLVSFNHIDQTVKIRMGIVYSSHMPDYERL